MTALAAPRLVWITRAEPGASETAERLRALGIEPVVEPLLQVRPVPGPAPDLTDAALIAFTSANAVRAFAARSPERGLPAIAVGGATAAAARAAGFERVESADGDVLALAAALRARTAQIGGAIVHVAAAEPAADLGALLAGSGLTVRRVTVYEMVARAPDPGFLGQRLTRLEGALVHSARAGVELARILAKRPTPQLVAWCMSDRAAAPLAAARLAALDIAARPDEASLLALLRA